MLSSNWIIFLASFLVFLILNTFENILHYNIGRTSNKDEIFIIETPTQRDSFRILIIMLLFAFLQGVLTVGMDLFLTKH